MQERNEETASPTIRKPRILIVDDSLTIRMDLQQAFESADFEVSLCATIAAARAALSRETPSLVILDVLLPDGDGIDLLREIKTADIPAPPVMMLSTEAEIGDRLRGLQTGAEDYVGKPYDIGYVLARARELTGNTRDLPRGSARRILLIDDSPTSRQHFQSILESAHYTVLTAENGEEGLRTAFVSRPDAIVVDRVLPGGIDGNTVIRRIKQDARLRTTPCLLLTGSDEEGTELSGLEAGADAFLTKETDDGVLLARLGALVRSACPAPDVDDSLSGVLGARRILAVDDSITWLSQLSAELRQEGYDVVQAVSGREALDLLTLQHVDCILLDVRMPGLSGNETCQIIKESPQLRAIPLLMVTAAEESEALISGINSGADDYIFKSSDFTILKARVRAQLRRKQFEDEYRVVREELHRKELEATQATAERQLVQTRAALADELEKKNHELEAFSYAVSHDLRAPLRAIRGFSRILIDNFSATLPQPVQEHLSRIHNSAMRMGQLIDSLLELSRSSSAHLHAEMIDLSALASTVFEELADANPGREVNWSVEAGLEAYGDPALLRVMLQNLLGNAWKFTGKAKDARISLGAQQDGDKMVYVIRDNGAGFDSFDAPKLFEPFERLHPATEFPGAGIGLATVKRILNRHSGSIRAESAIGRGAAFFFTLAPPPARPPRAPECASPDAAECDPRGVLNG
ncbi:MAG TPA: response regulator [Bryobacteraceae bacterium]|nr:response regulator [Bryobacteraceae bacterium]